MKNWAKHGKPTKWCNHSKHSDQWSNLHSLISVCCVVYLEAKNPIFLYADIEDSDQTVQMCWLIWLFAVCPDSNVFCLANNLHVMWLIHGKYFQTQEQNMQQNFNIVKANLRVKLPFLRSCNRTSMFCRLLGNTADFSWPCKLANGTFMSCKLFTQIGWTI